MLRRVALLIDSCVDKVLIAFSIVAVLICCYAMFDAAMVYYNANDTGVLKYKPELGAGAETLRELSEDAIAWLTVDGTKIDYPVMQGENNAEYVNKNPYGKFALSGSIFLDSRNSPDFTDPYSLLYGHHMEYGMMFGALDDYLNEDFLDTHRTGRLVTVSGSSYDIVLFASLYVQANEKVVFDPPESSNTALLEYLKEHAQVYAPVEGHENDSILALSTCTTAESLDRTVVFGMLTTSAW